MVLVSETCEKNGVGVGLSRERVAFPRNHLHAAESFTRCPNREATRAETFPHIPEPGQTNDRFPGNVNGDANIGTKHDGFDAEFNGESTLSLSEP